ncbi:tyrosine-protein kinase Lyn-like [Culicoides brevitarsis]|uniref:tyrosine-protein kinase Lyn-like n=1 Tax=Culicoides brevitarsis TaxID=469753 RepID=UPI00307BA741
MGNQRSKPRRSLMATPNRYRKTNDYFEPEDFKDRSEIYLALKDHEARSSNELSFKKGEVLELIKKCISRDHLLMKDLKNTKYGFVPKESVAEINSLRAQEYYFEKVSRRQAESLIMFPGNCTGTFIVRPSQSVPGSFSLTVKDYSMNRGFRPRNYRINVSKYGNYSLQPSVEFKTVPELISYYQKSVTLCHLVRACPKIEESPNRRQSFAALPSVNEFGYAKNIRKHSLGANELALCNRKSDVIVKRLKLESVSEENLLDEAYQILNDDKFIALYATFNQNNA